MKVEVSGPVFAQPDVAIYQQLGYVDGDGNPDFSQSVFVNPVQFLAEQLIGDSVIVVKIDVPSDFLEMAQRLVNMLPKYIDDVERQTTADVTLAALFSLDSFAGGFVLQSLVAYYLHVHHGLTLEALGQVFFVAQLLSAASLLVAARGARRFGLLNTMVVSHLISNVFLIGIALAPSASVAVALLLLRQLLSQMDVPTRQAYVMGVVQDHEREAAAATTTLWRTVTQAISPALTGYAMQWVALSAPFVLGGTLKILYDVLLYRTFRDVVPRE
jgi:hypothetical protein